MRKEYLDSFESSLSSGSGSPDPMFAEEERTFTVMEAEHANLQLLSSTLTTEEELILQRQQSLSPDLVEVDQSRSTHSLYPTCVEVKRSPSVMSGTSDFAGSKSHLVSAGRIDRSANPPVASRERGAARRGALRLKEARRA